MADSFQPWRTVSVFVSSTFIDMDTERDYLRDIVLKELQEVYEPLRVSVQLIDLRWGINTKHIESEEEREQTILQVCLDEINRSKPFFISLLGDRYGWIPDKNITDRIRFSEEDGVTNREISEVSVTEIEILFGALCKHELLEHSLFFFRNPDSYRHVPLARLGEFQDEYADLPYEQKRKRVDKLTALKGKITRECWGAGLNGNIVDYTLEWKDGRFTGLEAWGEGLKRRLKQKIDDYLSTATSPADGTSDKEVEKADYFIDYNVNSFVGRGEELEYLKSVAFQNQTVIHGESGIGKSALMCKLYSLLVQGADADTLILFHSGGISSYAQSAFDVATSWMRQIYVWLGKPEIGDNRPLIDHFRVLMSHARERGKRVLVMVDALDRFMEDNDSRFLPFIPDELPVIISVLPDRVESLKLQHPKLQAYRIRPFSEEDARMLVTNKLKASHKNLPEDVLTALFDKGNVEGNAYKTPLWLILATDMLISLDENDFRHIRGQGGASVEQNMSLYMREKIAQIPGEAGPLFVYMLERAGKYFGEEYIGNFIKYLVFSNGGLRERDLCYLLEANSWSALKFARCRRFFKFLIVENPHSEQWYVAHNILVEQARNKFRHEKKGIHRVLADYFISLDVEDKVRNSELTTHLMEADDKFAFLSERANVDFSLFRHKFLEDPSYWARWTREVLLLLVTRKEGKAPFDYVHDLGSFLRQYYLYQQGVVIYSGLDDYYAELLKTDENEVPYDYYRLMQQFGYCYQGLGKYSEAADVLLRSMEWHNRMMRHHIDHSLHSRAIGYLDIAGLYFQAKDFDKALEASWVALRSLEKFFTCGMNRHVRNEPFKCRLLRANIYYEKQHYGACYRELLFANIAFHQKLSYERDLGDLYRLLWAWGWYYIHCRGNEQECKTTMEKICQLWGQARSRDNNEGVSFLYLRSLFMLNDVYCQTGEDKEKLRAVWYELFPLARQFMNKKGYSEVETWLRKIVADGAREPKGESLRVLDYLHYDLTSVDVLPEKECVENSMMLFFEEGVTWLRMHEVELAKSRFHVLAKMDRRWGGKYEPEDYNVEFTSLCNYLLCLFLDDDRKHWDWCLRSLSPEDREDSDIRDIVDIYSKHAEKSMEDKFIVLKMYFKGDIGYTLW